EREAALKDESTKLAGELRDVPSEQEVERAAKRLAATVKRLNSRLDKMTDDDKRSLCLQTLGGVRSNGTRFGVYVKRTDDGDFSYFIEGRLFRDVGSLNEDAAKSDWRFGSPEYQGELVDTSFSRCRSRRTRGR